MSDNQSDQPKQKTSKGLEIPVPTRKQVEEALDKMAKSKQPSTPTRRPKK
jgi:hypothetical protein